MRFASARAKPTTAPSDLSRPATSESPHTLGGTAHEVGTSRRIASLAVLAAFSWRWRRAGLGASAPTPPTPNKGDTAWMLTASALVLLMTVPGLALFYGGLVRTKNMLSMLMQVFYAVCIVMHDLGALRLQPGLHRGRPLNAFVRRLLQGIPEPASRRSRMPRPSPTAWSSPRYVYICFQMTFAAITPALIVGAHGGAHEVLRASRSSSRCG